MILLCDVLELFASAIADSSALAAWVTDRFGPGRVLKVFIGLDARNPPIESETPFVLLLPDTEQSGLQVREHSWIVEVHWAISGNEAHASGQVISHTRLRLAEELGEELWKVISEASQNVPVVSREKSLDSSSQFPLVIGLMRVTLSAAATIGAEPTL